MYTRQQFREADRGVSPVIGVILMIAITVVIATATGTLVLQLVDDRTSELEAGDVEAEFSVSYGTDTVTVTHAGGDDVPADQLLLDGDVERSQRWGEYGDVSPGDSVTVNATGSARTIVVVQVDRYGDEEVLLRSEE
jgi:flagellin-like protein